MALARAEKTARAASRERTEQARQTAALLMTDSAKLFSEQMRAAGPVLRLQLEQLIERSVRAAQAAASEASQHRMVSFEAATLATVCACLAAAVVGVACWKMWGTLRPLPQPTAVAKSIHCCDSKSIVNRNRHLPRRQMAETRPGWGARQLPSSLSLPVDPPAPRGWSAVWTARLRIPKSSGGVDSHRRMPSSPWTKG